MENRLTTRSAALWTCRKCTYKNHAARNVCEMCRTAKPSLSRAQGTFLNDVSSSSSFAAAPSRTTSRKNPATTKHDNKAGGGEKRSAKSKDDGAVATEITRRSRQKKSSPRRATLRILSMPLQEIVRFLEYGTIRTFLSTSTVLRNKATRAGSGLREACEIKVRLHFHIAEQWPWVAQRNRAEHQWLDELCAPGKSRRSSKVDPNLLRELHAQLLIGGGL